MDVFEIIQGGFEESHWKTEHPLPSNLPSENVRKRTIPSIRSILSTTMRLAGLLYESLNILLRYCTFATSLNPTIASGEMSLMYGNSEAIAIEAASAVFPLPEGPCINTLTRCVRSLVRTCSTYNFPSRKISYNQPKFPSYVQLSQRNTR